MSQPLTPMVMSIMTLSWPIIATPLWTHFHASHSLTTIFLSSSHPSGTSTPSILWILWPQTWPPIHWSYQLLILPHLLILLFPPYPAYSLVNNYSEFIPLYPFTSLALLSHHHTCSVKTTTLVKSKLPSILCLPLYSCLWLKKNIQSMITGFTLNPLSGITSWINNLHL